jgi:hypothetical protein
MAKNKKPLGNGRAANPVPFPTHQRTAVRRWGAGDDSKKEALAASNSGEGFPLEIKERMPNVGRLLA